MITLIAALYVVLPALYALACVAMASRSIRFSEPASEAPSPSHVVYRVVRDECARKAISALAMASRTQGAAQRMWLDVANVYRNRAEAYNAAIV